MVRIPSFPSVGLIDCNPLFGRILKVVETTFPLPPRVAGKGRQRDSVLAFTSTSQKSDSEMLE
jgi:hypothetical protein